MDRQTDSKDHRETDKQTELLQHLMQLHASRLAIKKHKNVKNVSITCPGWRHAAHVDVFGMIARMIKLVISNTVHYVWVQTRTLHITSPDRLPSVRAWNIVMNQPSAGVDNKTHHLTGDCRVLHCPTLTQWQMTSAIIHSLTQASLPGAHQDSAAHFTYGFSQCNPSVSGRVAHREPVLLKSQWLALIIRQ